VCISIEKLINHQKNNKCTAEKYISNLNAFQHDETRPDLNNCNGMIGGSDSRDDDPMDITETMDYTDTMDVTEDNANINNEQVDDHVDNHVDEVDEQVDEQGIFVLGIKRMRFTFLIL